MDLWALSLSLTPSDPQHLSDERDTLTIQAEDVFGGVKIHQPIWQSSTFSATNPMEACFCHGRKKIETHNSEEKCLNCENITCETKNSQLLYIYYFFLLISVIVN